MAFSIPNLPDAGYADQAEPDAVDFLMLGDRNFGTISGGAVTQTGSPSMAVAVGSVVAVVNGAVVSNAGGTVSITAAGANARFDLVTIDSSGNLGKVTGDSSTTNARFPTWDKTTAVLAAVYVPSGASSITNAMILDKRLNLDLSFQRRQSGATDVVFDVGDTATGSRFRINASGKHTWEVGAADITLSHDTVTDKFLNLVGSLVAQAVDTATATLTLKAISSQTANILEVRNSANTLVGSIDASGNATWGSSLIAGSGSPEGVQTAAIGTLYRQTDADATVNKSHLWVKETGAGNTGWIALMEYNPPLLTIPVGLMMPWPSATTIPANFLACDGSAVSQSTYSALYAVLGTSWGPATGGNFTLPDFRAGRVPVGLDSGTTALNTIGKTGGEQTHTLTSSEMPSHVHDISHTHSSSSTATAGFHGHSVSDPGHFHYMSTTGSDARMAGYIVRWNTNNVYIAPPYTSDPGGSVAVYYDNGNGIYTQSRLTGISVGSDPGHVHTVFTPSFSGNSGSVGSGTAHNVMGPYGVVTWVIKAA